MKVALLQQEFKGTKEATIAKTLELITEAKKGGADLVVCQELHQTQYFCQSEDTNFFDHANDWQEDVAFWGKVAKENGVVLVTSLFFITTPPLSSSVTAAWLANTEKCTSLMTLDFTRNFTLHLVTLALNLLKLALASLVFWFAGISGIQRRQG